MTRRESAIITAFTGILCGPFEAFHEYVEEVLERPVFTHEMGSPEIAQEIKDKSKADFRQLYTEVCGE